MDKKGWLEALKEMERLQKVAVDNVEAAQKQLDELDFNVANYREKVETFK